MPLKSDAFAISKTPNSIGSSFVEDDRPLLDLIRQGDQLAMADLFGRHSPLVYSIALRVLHDSFAAEEVLQEIFMDIWRLPFGPETSPQGSLSSFLAIASRDRAVRLLRKRRYQESPKLTISVLNSSADAAPNDGLRAEQLTAKLATLSIEQKRILESAFFDGRTADEIAEEDGSSHHLVRTTLCEALKAFHS
jgi:RNA polymerase sigma-70 factor (ECF subfamily)